MPLPEPNTTAAALITGASQGIGKAIAEKLALYGHNLILVARRQEVLEELAAKLEAAHGITAEVYACDLAQKDQLDQLVRHVTNREISILINSAGIASFGPFMDQDWAYEVAQFNLNATAVFRLTRAVLPGMLSRRSGAICNVGSAAGNIPIPNNATYVFTKAGVNAFTESLHFELKKTGVHCTLLAPGPVREADIPESEKSIVDKVVPDVLWTTYDSCAAETLEALAHNKRRVVPGPLSKAMNAISQVAPAGILSPVMGWFYAKMG
ncbi:short-chain dehydrogenase [Corynebacterium atypicum]|uniref:Short-chain dehydrogenase n=1 Tax=Corynebacterium atypicum TaxID=191610 RepID=A0ABM5QP16_9CORY|nr:mycolate reductase [Corynebacterium atypicum]AIG64584.1 short-chain dehydrogenase [Corynebacterium atypicum]